MQWFRAQAALKGHPKIRGLARAMHVSEAHALGWVFSLWCETALHADDGILRGWTVHDLCRACTYGGRVGVRLAEALLQFRLVDRDVSPDGTVTFSIHDWQEWNAPNLKERKRKAEWREKQRTGLGRSGPEGQRRPTDGRTDVRTDVRTDSGPSVRTPLPPGVTKENPLKEYGHRGVLRAMGEIWFDNAELLGIGWRDKSPALYAWDTTVEGWEWTRKRLAKGLREKGKEITHEG